MDAATELFLRDGYTRTSLSSIAERAGVSERIVYVRFGSKVRLYQRVIDNGTVGDVDEAPLPEREWSVRCMSAPTLAQRIEAFADGVSEMHERLGPLMAINNEVEATEPDVQVSAAAARMATLDFLRTFWDRAHADGLIAAGSDLGWLTDTTATLSAAETRLLISRAQGWDRATYREWLIHTWTRLAAASTP